jgi:hypothetical protein
MSGAIKINSEKIKHIKWINQGLRFDQDNSGCNLGITIVLGTENKGDIKQKKREGVPRGSARLGQLSSRVPLGNLPLVHVSK